MAKKKSDSTAAAPAAPASTETPAPAGDQVPPPPAPAGNSGHPAAPPVETPAPEAPKIKGPNQNGVSRPSADTQTRKVWDTADQITAAKNGVTATRKEVVEACVALGVNHSTATTQFGKWCKFHGFIAEKSPGKPAAPAVPAPAIPAPAAAPVDPIVVATQAGADAYAAAQAGNAVTNPYVAGSPECDAFTAGWTAAAQPAV